MKENLDKVTFIKGQRGKDLVLLNGFIYAYSYSGKDFETWRCKFMWCNSSL